MSGRTTCVQHPPRSRFLAVRPHYLEICEGDHCAACLLSVFEGWTNVRLSNREERDGTPWIFRTREGLRDDLLGLFGLPRIDGAVDKLVELGLIERRRNPRLGWDRAWQYRLEVDVVQDAISLATQSSDSEDGSPPSSGKEGSNVASQRIEGAESEGSNLPAERSNTREPKKEPERASSEVQENGRTSPFDKDEFFRKKETEATADLEKRAAEGSVWHQYILDSRKPHYKTLNSRKAQA